MADEKPKPTAQSENSAEWLLLKQKAEAERDALKAALEAQKALATQELEIVKAQQGLLSQLIPKGETKPLEGTVSASGEYEQLGRIIAHEAINLLADHLAGEIDKAMNTSGTKDASTKEHDNSSAEAGKADQKSPVILIVDSLDWAPGDAMLLEVQSQINGFNTTLNRQVVENLELLQEEPPAGVGVAAVLSILPLALGAVSSLADIVGYFKTDYTVKGTTFDLNQEVLASAVAGKLNDEGRTIYIGQFHKLDKSQLMQDLADAQQLAISLQATAKRLSHEIIESATGSSGGQQVLPELKQKAAAAVQGSDALLTALDAFTKSITVSPNDKTPPKLVQAALRQEVKELGVSHLLCLSIQASAGEAITTKSRLTGSDHIRLIAGVSLIYVLAQVAGSVLASGNLSEIVKWDCPLSGDEVGVISSIGNFREH